MLLKICVFDNRISMRFSLIIKTDGGTSDGIDDFWTQLGNKSIVKNIPLGLNLQKVLDGIFHGTGKYCFGKKLLTYKHELNLS